MDDGDNNTTTEESDANEHRVEVKFGSSNSSPKTNVEESSNLVELEETKPEIIEPEHTSTGIDDDQVKIFSSNGDSVNEENYQASSQNPKKSIFRRIFNPKLILPRGLRKKFGRAATPIASLIILLIVGGIAYGAVTIVHKNKPAIPEAALAIKPIKPFDIVSTVPNSGEINVQDDSKITINFNQPVSAKKLQNSFIVRPSVKGTVSQGANSDQVIYTPSVPFRDSTIVKIMIDNSFESQLGQKLTSDYMLGFTTQTPANGVEFQYQDEMVNLVSAQSSTNVPLQLSVGNQVASGGQLIVYKASIDPLLSSLEYTVQNLGGYNYDNPNYDSVDTTGMQQVDTSSGLKDQSTFNLNEPDGIYLVAAIANGKQVGWTWVVFNDNGTVMRQDYQKIVLSTFNLSTNATVPSANVSFYNLQNGVNTLKTASLQSPEAFNFPYTPQVDMAVITVGQDTMVVPISLPNSLADNRVAGNLSQVRTFYAVTDKPSYQVNDTLKFAGYVSIDNDAQFSSDPETSLKVFVASQDDPTTHLEDFTLPVGSNGAFNGEFDITKALASQQDLAIYGYQDTADQNPYVLATFSIVGTPSKYSLNVAFSKTNYLASDKVNATITGTNANGQPLANTSVTYNIYSVPYYENNPTENLGTFGTTGNQVGEQNQKVQLNSQGQAVVSVDTSALQLLTLGSQVVTVQASMTDPSSINVEGGATAVVHQGNAILNFGISKTYFNQTDTRFARVYATDLNGKPLANATVNYQFVTYTYNNSTGNDDPTIIASGEGVTDSNGYLQISQQLNTTQDVTIIASTQDSYGNQVEAEEYTYTNQDSTPVMAGADNLDYLDVSGSSGQVTVGDHLSLTITSPTSLNVLVSYERGLIYSYQTLQLNQGTNNYTLDVAPDLAPSFNLVFSYFVDGEYHTEGTSFTVTNPQQQLSVGISPDHSNYKSGQTANISIDTTNGDGQSVPANLIVSVESDSMFNMGLNFEPDMYTFYYSTREYSTNSSSSLTGIGSGGGGCGGGGGFAAALGSNTGTTLYWNPNISTDSSGNTEISVPLQTGKWHVLVYAMGSGGSVGSSQTIISAQ